MYYLFYKLCKTKYSEGIYLWLITNNTDVTVLKNYGIINGRNTGLLSRDTDEWMIVEGDNNEKIIKNRMLSLQEFKEIFGEWNPE